MASGTITGYTGNEYIDAKIVWSSTPTISTNKSSVTAALYYKRNNTGFTTYGTGTFSISINGVKTSETKTLTITESAWVKAVEATETVTHNNDGTKSIVISAAGSISGTTLVSTTVTDTVDLDTIPRASTIDSLSCATKYFNGKMTYKYTPKSASYYNRCNISLNIDGTYTAVKTINLGKQSAAQKTATVTLAEDELSIIYNKLPKTTKGILRFTFRTYSNSGYSSQIGDPTHKEITLYIPNIDATKPTVTMTLAPVTSLASPFDTLYIKGRTKVDANFTNGEGKYGASIVSYSLSVNGKSYGSPYTSDYLSTTGSVTVKGVVTDSRGYSREYTQTITVIDYSNPTILPASGEKAIICARCDSDGNLSESGTYLKIKAKRSYSKVMSGTTQNNFCSIRYRYREESSDTFSAWKTILGKTTLASDTADTNPLTGVVSSASTAYVIQVGVIDDIGKSDMVQFMIPTAFVTIDIPQKHKGRRIGVGRYAEDTDEDGVYVGLPIFGGSIDSLKLGTLLTATSSAPIDLNDIKTVGCYYSSGASNSQYIANSPYTTGGFGLEVRELQSKNYIRQTLYYGRTTFIRHWNGSEWSAWLRYLVTTEVDSTVEDFVTDIGVTYIDPDDTNKGYWRYRKWRSGVLDLNGYIKVTPIKAGTLSGTSVYYSEQIQIDLPFSVETFQYTAVPTTDYFIITNASVVDGNTIGFRLLRFTDINVGSVYVRIMASGRYK